MRCLPPALQFEVLDEIKNAERNRRSHDIVRQRHTAESFSHQQLRNYIEVSKVAAKVDGLRKELAQGQKGKRIAADASREYVFQDANDDAALADSGNGGDGGDGGDGSDGGAGGGGFFDDGDGGGFVDGEADSGGATIEEQNVARAMALSVEGVAADAGADSDGGGGFLPDEGGSEGGGGGGGGGFLQEDDGDGGGFLPEAVSDTDDAGGGFFPETDGGEVNEAPQAARPTTKGQDDLATAVALSMEDAAAVRRREGKLPMRELPPAKSALGAQPLNSTTRRTHVDEDEDEDLRAAIAASLGPGDSSAARGSRADPLDLTETEEPPKSKARGGSCNGGGSGGGELEVDFDLDDCKKHDEVDDEMFPRSTFGGYEDGSHPYEGGGGSSESGDDDGVSIEVDIESEGEDGVDLARAIDVDMAKETAGEAGGGGERAAAAGQPGQPGQPDSAAGLSGGDGASWRMQAKKRMWSTMKATNSEPMPQHLPLGPSVARSASSGSDLARHVNVPGSHVRGQPEASQNSIAQTSIDLTAELRAPTISPRAPTGSSSRMEAPLSRASADAPSPSVDVTRSDARGTRGASASTLAGHAESAPPARAETASRSPSSSCGDSTELPAHAETTGGIEQGVAEVMEAVDEDWTGAVQTMSAGEAAVEKDSSERRAPVEPFPSVEARQEPRQEVEGSDDGLGARAGAEEGTAAGAEEGAAVCEEELTELRLRAPAGLTTDELRYMLSQSVADCAAALPDISAAMVWDACPKRLGGAAARVPQPPRTEASGSGLPSTPDPNPNPNPNPSTDPEPDPNPNPTLILALTRPRSPPSRRTSRSSLSSVSSSKVEWRTPRRWTPR